MVVIVSLSSLHRQLNANCITNNMSKAVPGGYDGSPNGVDLNAHPTASKLVKRVGEFLDEVKNL